MDIVDVILAKALTPQGQIESYAATAQAAVTKANQAVNNINTITQQTNTNNQLAAEAVENANAAIAALNAAIENMEDGGSMDTAAVDAEIKKLVLSTSNSTSGGAIAKNLVTKYPDNTTRSISNIVKYYKGTGDNEDGTMTQKAITAALAAIPTGGGGESIPSGGTDIHIEGGHSGEFIIIDDSGNIVASGLSADELMVALMKDESYFYPDSIGLKIDYENISFSRPQGALDVNNISSLTPYGGRMKCTVADDGTITSFYGDNNYVEDGSIGQVMVYQPKFYYCRIPITMENNVIRKEILILSPTARPGFKLHPLFINEDGEELEYALLSGYDGSSYDVSENKYDLNDSINVDLVNDKLASVANAKPISGANKQFTPEVAEHMAQNRGTGWHITNMCAESANQMLATVEFGKFNGQEALELGVVNITNYAGYNCASLTGSTANLGNNSGVAEQTVNEVNNTYTTYNTSGKRAITYRGMENPWGNIWHIIGGVTIRGNGNEGGGVPYICTDYNYSYSGLTDNYKPLGYRVPVASGYASAFGYNKEYDWIYLAAENNGNRSVPIGDKTWVVENLNGYKCVINGGSFISTEAAGLFGYGYDQELNIVSRTIGAKLMFIPTKNSIYENNILNWKDHMEATTL